MREVEVAYLTDGPGGNAFSRKADALMYEFERRGLAFDLVYIRGPKRIEQHGDHCRRIWLGDVRAAFSTPALTRYLRATRPRMAMLVSGQMGPAAMLASRLSGVPVVPWEGTMLDRDLPSMPPRMRIMAAAQKVTYPWAGAIFAPSEDMARWVRANRRIAPERVWVLENPVDLEVLERATNGTAPPDDGLFRMCATGRLVEQKGYDVMLEALAIAAPSLPDRWQLTIIGEEGTWRGGWKDRIEALARTHGIQDSVVLAGQLDNPYALMKQADLFLHSARWEPFGTVLVEALALGLPVVAADSPGGPAVILDGGRYGRLVPVGDADAFARAVVELAGDNAARAELCAAGPERARSFSPARAADRVLEVARQVGR